MQNLRQQQLFDRVFDRLPDHVTLLLIIISGFLLARLTWMMFPSDPTMIAPLSEQDMTSPQGVSVIKAHAKSPNLGQEIASYHLLGVYKPAAPQKVVQAKPAKAVQQPKPKKPRPSLQLVGVYALSGKPGIAVINVKGKQQVIGVGEMIADSHGKLVKVSAESVEISWDGEIDKLHMPNIDKTASSAMQLPAGQQPQAAPQQPAAMVQSASLRTQGQRPIVANNGASNRRTNGNNPVNARGNNVNRGAGATTANANRTRNTAQGQQPAQARPSNNVNRNLNRGSNAPANGGSVGTNASAPRLADFRQQIMNNNINLLKVIRPSPKRENGKLVGFRIRPGTNRALFQQTGLQSGDIVTHVNGTALNSNSASMQAMQSLTTSSSATLNVLRGGQTTTVQVSF